MQYTLNFVTKVNKKVWQQVGKTRKSSTFSHICPTSFPHVSHILPTYFPSKSYFNNINKT